MLTAQEIEEWDCGGEGEGTMLTGYCEPGELRRYVEGRGFRVEAEFTDPKLTTHRVSGYWLKGPRGSKFYVSLTPAGLVCMNAARLWCDGVDYASNKLHGRVKCDFMV